jgi:hypothetical protein
MIINRKGGREGGREGGRKGGREGGRGSGGGREGWSIVSSWVASLSIQALGSGWPNTWCKGSRAITNYNVLESNSAKKAYIQGGAPIHAQSEHAHYPMPALSLRAFPSCHGDTEFARCVQRSLRMRVRGKSAEVRITGLYPRVWRAESRGCIILTLLPRCRSSCRLYDPEDKSKKS